MAIEESVYNYALEKLEPVIRWLDEGYHVRDSRGQIITRLDQLLIAIEDGYWPVRVKNDNDKKMQQV